MKKFFSRYMMFVTLMFLVPLNYSYSQTTTVSFEKADVNGDNHVDISDIVAVINFIAYGDNNNNNPEKYSFPPEFESLILSPSTVVPGDSVTAIVKYIYPGENLFKSKYELTISGNNNTGQYKKMWEWEVLNPVESEPIYKFVSPDEPGIYQISFRATRISYNCPGINGEIYGYSNTVTEMLNVIAGD